MENVTRTIEDKIICIEKKVNELHLALVGDEYDKDKGFIPRLKKVESYIEVDKKIKWVGGGIVLAIGATIGSVSKNIMSWLSTHL
jgi:hypothetical protein